MKYINDRVSELDKKKYELENQLDNLQHGDQDSPIKQLSNCMKVWDAMSIDDKISVARLLIQKIRYTQVEHILNGKSRACSHKICIPNTYISYLCKHALI